MQAATTAAEGLATFHSGARAATPRSGSWKLWLIGAGLSLAGSLIWMKIFSRHESNDPKGETPAAYADAVIAAYDASGDGIITPNERVRERRTYDRDYRWGAGQYQEKWNVTNTTQPVHRDELFQAVASQFGTVDKDTLARFVDAEADTDGNGELSKSERQAFNQRFPEQAAGPASVDRHQATLWEDGWGVGARPDERTLEWSPQPGSAPATAWNAPQEQGTWPSLPGIPTSQRSDAVASAPAPPIATPPAHLASASGAAATASPLVTSVRDLLAAQSPQPGMG